MPFSCDISGSVSRRFDCPSAEAAWEKDPAERESGRWICPRKLAATIGALVFSKRSTNELMRSGSNHRLIAGEKERSVAFRIDGPEACDNGATLPLIGRRVREANITGHHQERFYAVPLPSHAPRKRSRGDPMRARFQAPAGAAGSPRMAVSKSCSFILSVPVASMTEEIILSRDLTRPGSLLQATPR